MEIKLKIKTTKTCLNARSSMCGKIKPFIEKRGSEVSQGNTREKSQNTIMVPRLQDKKNMSGRNQCNAIKPDML